MTRATGNHYLSTVTSIAAVSGVAFAVIALIPGGAERLLRLLAVPGTEVADGSATAVFCVGLVGAVMAGWAVTLRSIAGRMDELDAAVIGAAATRGLLTWFALDGVVSVAGGFAWNLVPNVGFLLLLLIPARRAGTSARRGDPDGSRREALAPLGGLDRAHPVAGESHP